MLRNLGIRSKLLAVLAVPMLVLVLGAAVVSLQAVNAASDARQVRAISDGARSFSDLVTALQAERRVSQAKLTNDYTLGGSLKSMRKQTDAAAKATDDLTNRIGLAKLSPEAAKALSTNLQARSKLGAVRKQVDKGTISATSVGAIYSAAIAEEIQIPARIAESLSDRKLAAQLRSYSELELAFELATQERDLGRQVLNDPGAIAAYTTAVSRESDAIQAYWYDASIFERSRMTRVLDTGSINKQFAAARASLLAVASGKAPKIEDQSWVFLANHNVSVLQGLASDVAVTASASAADSATAATNRSWQIVGLALLVLLIPILLALVVARAITRPLRRLTDAAGQVRDELPRLVETMATPGETPDTDLIRIPVTSQDEVGKLAAAFNDVNQTTMKIAREQAALRGSIAEMFVNVARRNHVLLSRQLSFIDQLERTEENPDTLDDLFKLDHLATRMRRNAESLIVLAGIDSGRRVRQAMPLSDVVRTAISEIEKYERVDMALRADPPVVGHVALTTAHLLAELLENATQFSNPDTRVFVVTSYSRRGVRVKITDAGLGMTYDEITDANQRIANPPATDVVGASRLGFFVVGRLARRLDARVTLRAARDRGTVVVIDLPAALFVPGTVAEVTGIDDDDEPLTENADPRTESPAAPGSVVMPPPALPSRGIANPHAPRVPSSSEPPPPSTPKAAAPFPFDFGAPADAPGGSPVPTPVGGATLPQRGGPALPQRGDTPAAPQRGTATQLPRRSRAAVPQNLVEGGPAPSEPVQMPTPMSAPAAAASLAEPVAETKPSKRPGLFSGFRSSKSAPDTPDPLLSPLPELPAETGDALVAEEVERTESVAPAAPVEAVDQVEALANAPEAELTEVRAEAAEPAEVAEVVDELTTEEAEGEVAPLSPLAESLAASLALTAAEDAEAEAEAEAADVRPVESEESEAEATTLESDLETTAELAPVAPTPYSRDSLFAPDEDMSLALIDGIETANDVAPLEVPEPIEDELEPEPQPRSERHFFPFQRRHVDPADDAVVDEVVEVGAPEAPVAEAPRPEAPIAEAPVAEVQVLEPAAFEATVDEPSADTTPTPTQRASVFQHFPTRRAKGRHYKAMEETGAPQPLAAEPVAFEAVADEPVAPVVDEPIAAGPVVPTPFPTSPFPTRASQEAAAAEATVAAEPSAIEEPVAHELYADEPVAVEEPVVDEPGDVPAEVPAPPSVSASFTEAAATNATVAPEPVVEAPPAPAPTHAPVGVLDILPGGAAPKSRRLHRPWGRAVKPTAAPVPTRSSTPPAYTRAPVPPPVVPTPAAPMPAAPVAPVPVAREGSAGAAAPAFGGAPEVPAPSLFGTRAGDADGANGAGWGAAPAPAGLFGAPAPAASSLSPSEFEEMRLRERSAIASEALSELSRLSGYRPAAVENRSQESLVRRTPQATSGVEPAPENTTPVPHRERDASDVRSMLSGFRAGVERGRADQGRGSES
jgi:signal transduction histidine kinase